MLNNDSYLLFMHQEQQQQTATSNYNKKNPHEP